MELSFSSRQELEAWLAEHHASADELWIRFAKAGSGVPSVRSPEAIEIALCFGWIDGLRQAVDETYFRQRYTPRRARSRWSKINRAKAEALIASGAMRPAGLAEVERAKADGRWEAAYDSPRNMRVPEDLQAELDRRPAAAAAFATLNSTNRYAILYRLHDAKKPETRARRLERFVTMLERGETLY